MTGDGRENAARTPIVTVLGAGRGDPDVPEGGVDGGVGGSVDGVDGGVDGADVLAAADAVLTTPAVESTVLFYAEAWRVERLPDLLGAAATAVELIGLGAMRIVLVVSGDPTTNPGCRALLDGLRIAGIEALARPGVSVLPPRLSPMPW